MKVFEFIAGLFFFVTLGSIALFIFVFDVEFDQRKLAGILAGASLSFCARMIRALQGGA